MASNTEDFKLISDILRRKPLPSDCQTSADIQHVLEHGYVIIPDCFTKEEAKEARDEIQRLLGSSPPPGRNPFEGLSTNRIYSLLNKSRVFDKFAVIPRVLALNDYFLDPGYLLSAFHTISINRMQQSNLVYCARNLLTRPILQPARRNKPCTTTMATSKSPGHIRHSERRSW